MQIKTKKHFNEVLKNLSLEIFEEEDLDEMTTTGDVDGYSTPNWGRGETKKGKKKNKKISTNSTGYEVLDEALDGKDLEVIKKLIRNVVGDIYRDIWLKRNSWK